MEVRNKELERTAGEEVISQFVEDHKLYKLKDFGTEEMLRQNPGKSRRAKRNRD
jgi:hypothetical protein